MSPSTFTPTPPGWLDIHGHFYPPASPSERKQKWEAMRAGLFLVPESATEWSASTVLPYLDRAGVQMQMLSNIPPSHSALSSSNDHAASLVSQHPTRFGMLAALPTDDMDAALKELERTDTAYEKDGVKPDGYAVTCCYNGVHLGDTSCDPLWAELNKRRAVVFTHPNAYAPGVLGRPAPLVEVAFETCRTVVQMLFEGVFSRYPDITWVISHAGGALPALAGRVKLLGPQAWCPGSEGLTSESIRETLGRLYVDTAATAMQESLGPAVRMVGKGGLVYGSDCGVPCSTDETMEENRRCLMEEGVVKGEEEVQGVGRRGWDLFPRARERVVKGGEEKMVKPQPVAAR